MSRKTSPLDISSPNLLINAEDYLGRIGSRVSLLKELLSNNWRHLEESEEFTMAREDMLDSTVAELEEELEVVTKSLLDALQELSDARVGAR